jgi:hypothetical protein
MKADAETGGLYFASSTFSGYQIVLKTNDTFDLFRVNSLRAVPSGCTSGVSGWGSWTASSTNLTSLGNYPFPANGLIFLDDNVWVEGTIDGARLTIVAARIPDNDVNQRRSMTFNNDIMYTNYNGTDVIALIGQNNVNAGLYSDDNLRVDAALVAQNGRVGRFSYSGTCAPYDRRTTLTLYGTIVTALQYGFAYGDPVTNGYSFRNLIYDAFLLYSPPPFFPETDDFHEVISWKEIE